MAHQYFNINTKKEWDDILVPSLRVLVSNEEGDMNIIERGNIKKMDIFSGMMLIVIEGELIDNPFSDFFLIDDDNTLQLERTQHLRCLATELFLPEIHINTHRENNKVHL